MSLSEFKGAELTKQAWTSGYKSYVITKRCLKTIGMNEQIKWSQADLNRLPPACHAVAKKTANTSNCLICDSFLIKPSAEISTFLSRQT